MIKKLRMVSCLQNSVPLPQTRVLGPGCCVNGNVAIGVFPEGEEIFIGCERSDAGGGIRPLRSVRLQCIRSRQAQVRQRASPAVPDDAAVIEDLLELGGG
jgi:hypothetical protein